MKATKFFSIENVSSFQGFDVVNGEVSVDDSEFVQYLNDIYGQVDVCGYKYDAGSVLEDTDPVAFRCGKSNYESDLQANLESQLDNEDESDIEFINDEDEFEDEE